MIDPVLNTELRNGKEDAYKNLYVLIAPRLKNYCKLFIKDQVLIEDMVQNTFVKLWEKRKSITDDKSVESFLFTMIRNQCLNYLRDQKVIGENISIEENQWSELQHLYQIDFKGEEEKTLEEQLFEALKLAIEQLPERQNEIFVKCKVEGKKQKDVAEELGISVKAVEKSIAKSKSHLQELLKASFPELSVLILILFNNHL